MLSGEFKKDVNIKNPLGTSKLNYFYYYNSILIKN